MYIEQFSPIKERNTNILPSSWMLPSGWFGKNIDILNLSFQGNILSKWSSREGYEPIFAN